MVQVCERTKQARYLDEAIASAERLRGKGFELLYQSKITIMSALTLAKIWKITGNRLYFDQSCLGIAKLLSGCGSEIAISASGGMASAPERSVKRWN